MRKIRLNLVDPLTEKEKDYIIGPKKMQELIKKVHDVLGTRPPIRLYYFLIPEAFRVLSALCKEHNELIRQSSVFTPQEFRMLDFLGFVALPSHLAKDDEKSGA
jgi:hypothetical protein